MSTCNCTGVCRTGLGCYLGSAPSFIGYSPSIYKVKNPYKCPVCEGSGQHQWLGGDNKCASCKGEGIVWG